MPCIMRPARFLLLLLVIVGTALPSLADATAVVHTGHATAVLLSRDNSLLAGGSSTVAVELTPQPGWHTYWRNPGDAGLPTRLQWTLPAGVSAGSIRWPAPQRILLGGIANYGYDHPVLLQVPISVPADWPSSKPMPLAVKARWLVCKDICVPEHAELSLTLPVTTESATPDPVNAAAFAAADLPQPLPAGWQIHFDIHDHDHDLSLGLQGRGIPVGPAVFFPDARDLINHSALQRVARDADSLRLSAALSDRYTQPPAHVRGVLAFSDDGQQQAYAVDAAPGPVAAVAESAATTATAAPAAAPIPTVGPGFGLVLLFALLGGLILNLMPCVFPVLSIKALSLVKSRSLARPAQRRHGYAYSAGVVLSCVLAAGLLLALRAGGQALGWGFQLQSPPFVAALAYLMFALGLSLSGLIGFGGGLMGMGQSLTTGGGYASSFFTGVLAVLVASPCSAPFMGTALGYALTQPPVAALAIFAVLGLGLASPFLLIGLFPRLGAWLPRPGAWMETFKQLMAFPLYLTAVWLVWVLARQQGADAAALVLVGMVLLALGLWVRGRWPQARLALALLLLCMVGAGALLARPALTRTPVATATAAVGGVEPYSAARLAALRAQGRTVFVNFTADWCLTCKVNEHVALASAQVRQAFRSHNVAWLEGDWTRSDPAITRALARFGRSGVPLYLIYHGQNPARVLPQVLSPGDVVTAVSGDDPIAVPN